MERGIYSALARRLAIWRNKFRVPTQHHSSHPEKSEMRTFTVERADVKSGGWQSPVLVVLLFFCGNSVALAVLG
jgi:hypothetical protein